MEEIDDILAATGEDAPEEPEEENGSSWILEDDAAIKQSDRHVFLFRETVLPPAVREFFGVEGLEPGRKAKIVLWHGEQPFEAQIEKTMHAAPLTRLRWRSDFAGLLQKEYPQWMEFFTRSRSESPDTPALQFTRRPEPGQYAVELEGVRPRDETGEIEVPFLPGETISNETLRRTFRCSPQGSMRRSLRMNSLVLISDHTKSVYEDKWIGKVFHYTGLGITGEQSLAFQQNQTLAGSRENGTALYLFEVFEPGKYVYIGAVELMDNPYRSRQADSTGTLRDVWVFPLRIRGNRHPPLLKHGQGAAEPGGAEAAAPAGPVPRAGSSGLPRDILRALHGTAVDRPQRDGGSAGEGAEPARRAEPVYADADDLFEPDDQVRASARERAAGSCQLCGLPAPFRTPGGEPYLEIHHIVPLKDGGTDTAENVVALCPNCHRKMHVLNLPADDLRLRNRAAGH